MGIFEIECKQYLSPIVLGRGSGYYLNMSNKLYINSREAEVIETEEHLYVYGYAGTTEEGQDTYRLVLKLKK
jgi:hypothetical protein